MYFTYQSGVTILEEQLQGIRENQYKVLVFFLGTEYDYEFLSSICELARDLDRITGPHCLAIAFMPKDRLSEGPGNRRIPALYPASSVGVDFDRPSDAQALKDINTQMCYELADKYGVPYKDLPCLLFVDTRFPDQNVALKVTEGKLHSIYGELRSIFSDWAHENRNSLSASSLRHALNSENLKSIHSYQVRRLVREKITPTVAHELYCHCERFINSSSKSERKKRDALFRLRSALDHILEEPNDISALHRVFDSNDIQIEIMGIEFNRRNIGGAYSRLHFRLIEESVAGEPNPVDDATPFPLNRVVQLARSQSISLAGNRLSSSIGRHKPVYDVLYSVLKFLKIAP